MEFGFGSGVLTGTRNDSAATSPVTPTQFGALQNVDIEFSGEVKELFSLSQFPIDTARGKTKITGKAKAAQISAQLYNSIFFGQTLSSGQLKYAFNESTTLTNTTVAPLYTIANSGSTPLVNQGVFYGSNGTPLTAVSSAPTQGQYIWNSTTGVYTFSTQDNSQGILVNYTYHVATGYNIAIGNPFMGTTPQFSMTLFQQYEGNQVVLVLNKCVSTRLTFPTRIDDYVIEDFDFSAFADASGNVGTWNSPS